MFTNLGYFPLIYLLWFIFLHFLYACVQYSNIHLLMRRKKTKKTKDFLLTTICEICIWPECDHLPRYSDFLPHPMDKHIKIIGLFVLIQSSSQECVQVFSRDYVWNRKTFCAVFVPTFQPRSAVQVPVNCNSKLAWVDLN